MLWNAVTEHAFSRVYPNTRITLARESTSGWVTSKISDMVTIIIAQVKFITHSYHISHNHRKKPQELVIIYPGSKVSYSATEKKHDVATIYRLLFYSV